MVSIIAVSLWVGTQAAAVTSATFAVVVLGTLGLGIGWVASVWAATGSILEREFLFRIFWIGLVIRLAVALFQYNYLSVDFFAPDQNAYHLAALRSADALAASRDAFSTFELKQRLYVAYSAYLYYFFGSSSLLPSVLNSVYGCLTAIVVYRITAIFDKPEAARIAALLAMFTPSHILWSALNLRDAPTILALVLSVYFMLRLRLELSVIAVAGFVLSMLVILGLRDYIFLIALGSLVTGYLGVRSGRTLEFLAGGILVIGAAVILFQAAPSDSQFMREISLEEFQNYRKGLLQGAQSAYLEDVDVSSPGGALLYLPAGLAYFLLAPFPWQWGSLRQAIAVPETLFMWLILPATIVGIARVARQKMNLALPMFVMMAGISISYSLVQGNVGTAFRHRAQVVVFGFIFSGIGLQLRREEKLKRLSGDGLPSSGTPATPNAPAGSLTAPSG